MDDTRPLVFADLDDTLFQSWRKSDPEELYRQAASAGNGDPHKASFMTIRQAVLFDWLCQSTELVPVTARSSDAFDRVTLPFGSWAILSNGAVVRTPDGNPFPDWQHEMHKRLAPLAQKMQELLHEGRSSAKEHGIDIRSWIVTEDNIATYVVFKLNVTDPGSIDALRNLPLPAEGWTRHFNSETLAMIPPGSGKAHAAAFLHQKLNPDNTRPTLGFGDSLSDLDFMKLADVMMVPGKSQIAAVL